LLESSFPDTRITSLTAAIVARGVFFADAERDFYLELLRKYFTQFQVDMAGYGLMSNHVHHYTNTGNASLTGERGWPAGGADGPVVAAEKTRTEN
jgi:hypothetical protein